MKCKPPRKQNVGCGLSLASQSTNGSAPRSVSHHDAELPWNCNCAGCPTGPAASPSFRNGLSGSIRGGYRHHLGRPNMEMATRMRGGSAAQRATAAHRMPQAIRGYTREGNLDPPGHEVVYRPGRLPHRRPRSFLVETTAKKRGTATVASAWARVAQHHPPPVQSRRVSLGAGKQGARTVRLELTLPAGSPPRERPAGPRQPRWRHWRERACWHRSGSAPRIEEGPEVVLQAFRWIDQRTVENHVVQ